MLHRGRGRTLCSGGQKPVAAWGRARGSTAVVGRRHLRDDRAVALSLHRLQDAPSQPWLESGRERDVDFHRAMAATPRRTLLHRMVQWGPRTELDNRASSNGLWFRLDTARHSGRRVQAVTVTSYLPDKSH